MLADLLGGILKPAHHTRGNLVYGRPPCDVYDRANGVDGVDAWHDACFEFIKKLWCCVGGRMKQENWVLSNVLSAVTTGNRDRETTLQTSQNKETNRIPFTLTYHSQNLAVKNVILKNSRTHISYTTTYFIQTRLQHR